MAPPVKITGEEVGPEVDELDEVEVVLDVEVAFVVASMNTPPATVRGETELAFTAAAL